MKCRVAILSTFAAIAVLVLPATLQAVPIFGTGSLGSFTGTFDYVATDDTLAQVTVVLNNTSPLANQGWITGFVFNIPAGVSLAVLDPADPNFDLLGGAAFDNSVNGAPFGQFDIGAGLGGDFEGGGSPVSGISVGGTRTFAFTLTGTNLSGLTADDFLSTLSEGVGAGGGHQAFVVRFRGFDDGGSDKVPVETTIPEPGTTLLLGAGLTALWARRARKR